MRKYAKYWAAGALASLILVACGGGGDSATPNPAPTPTPAPTPSPTPSPTPQVGLLDTTCNGTGKAVLKAGFGLSVDTASDAYGLADGSTVMYGNIDQPINQASVQSNYWSNLKLRPDCTIDTAYGNNGLNFFAPSNPDYQVEKLRYVSHLPDGTSYLFGESYQPTTLTDGSVFRVQTTTFTKLLNTGAQDTAYGVKVSVIKSRPDSVTPYPNSMTVRDSKVLADGKLLILSTDGGPSFPFAITRFNPDGSPDATFASGGKFVVPNVDPALFSASFIPSRVNSIDVQADGKIILGGYFAGQNGAPSFYPGVMRLNADFSVDATFGTNGANGLREGSPEDLTRVKVLSDGKILLFGTGGVQAPSQGFRALAVTRLLSNGQIDLSFGTSGVTRVDFDAGTFAAGGNSNAIIFRSAAVMPDGKIIMAGDSYNLDALSGTPGSKRHIGLVRLTAAGALDQGFATGGIYSGLEGANAANEIVSSVRTSEDGKLLVTATREVATGDSDWVLYRFTN